MFLLSNEEVKTYYLSNKLRTAKSSDYAKSQDLHVYAGERKNFVHLIVAFVLVLLVLMVGIIIARLI
jgi:hypothetical protein